MKQTIVLEVYDPATGDDWTVTCDSLEETQVVWADLVQSRYKVRPQEGLYVYEEEAEEEAAAGRDGRPHL